MAEKKASEEGGQNPSMAPEPPVEPGTLPVEMPEAPDAASDPATRFAADLAAEKERYLRLYAEFENYKKRTARENDDFRKYAHEGLLKELLPVLDNLDRAIVHGREATEGAGEKLLEGVEMVRKQFAGAIERCGVTPIPALGEPFNPALHQAVSQMEAANAQPGTVVEEFQKGYYYRERVLRPAMVVVARG